MSSPEVIYKEESYEIMGACFEVYKAMGSGFLESVYQECLEVELGLRGIPFKSCQRLRVIYKGIPLTLFYEADIICHDKIILELKSTQNITDQHRSQTLNYLKTTGFKLGLILNFGHYPLLQYERIALDK